MELDLESELQSLFVHEMSVAEPEKRFYVAGNKQKQGEGDDEGESESKGENECESEVESQGECKSEGPKSGLEKNTCKYLSTLHDDQ